MTTLNINLNLNITAAESVCAFFRTIKEVLSVPPTVTAHVPSLPASENTTLVEATSAEDVTQTEAVSSKGAASAAVAPGVKLAEGVIPVKGDEYTELDVRAAIERTRKRIEGEDYKNHPESEAYKKWHRALTTWFLTTAATYGAPKPSDLADHDSRRRFIESCERCIVENEELTEKLPF